MKSAVKSAAFRLSRPIGSTTRVDGRSDAVILTYDDGPRKEVTLPLLETLAHHRATATFFVLLSRVRSDPDTVSSLVAAGHEVALHGLDHRPLPTFTHAENLRRLRDGRRELEDVTGRPVRWMRPPYGRQRLQDWVAVRRAGMEPVLWTRSTWDTRVATDVERVSQAVDGVRGGDILLAHDGYADTRDWVDDGPEPALDRVALAESVLGGYRERGLAPMSLEVALAGGGTLSRRAWFSR